MNGPNQEEAISAPEQRRVHIFLRLQDRKTFMESVKMRDPEAGSVSITKLRGFFFVRITKTIREKKIYILSYIISYNFIHFNILAFFFLIISKKIATFIIISFCSIIPTKENKYHNNHNNRNKHEAVSWLSIRKEMGEDDGGP